MSSLSPFKIFRKNDLPVALVVGEAGFLGSALCQNLLRKKTRVLYLQVFPSGLDEKIADLAGEKNFRFLKYDLDQPLTELGPVDYIFHLASFENFLGKGDPTLETLQIGSQLTHKVLELTRQNHAKLLFISPLETSPPFLLARTSAFSPQEVFRFSEALITQYGHRHNLNFRIVRLADLYGPGISLKGKDSLTQLIKAVKEGKNLEIGEEGLENCYPIYIHDAVGGMMRAIFLANTRGQTYFLAGPKITVFKLAQTLQKISSQRIQIEFKKVSLREEASSKAVPDSKKSQEELNWYPKTSLEEGLRQTLFFEPKETAQPTESSPILPVTNLVTAKRRNRFLFPAVLLLTLILLFPFFSLSWDLFWGQRQLTVLEEKTLSLTPAVIQTQAASAELHLRQAQKKLQSLNWFFKLLGQERRRDEWDQKLMVGEKVAAGVKEVASAGKSLQNLAEMILGEGEIGEEELMQGRTSLSLAREYWGEAEAKLKENGSKEQSRAEKLARYRQILQVGENWLTILPQIIALDGRKTYLLLLQNNMEIRPTGGFIGSFGWVTFEKGKIIDLQIEDVYAADGQLRGHVEPPEPLKIYLAKEHWFLRDSNWDPDFPKSAQIAQWFLEKELGLKTDGVIAFDSNLAQKMLEVLGPLQLLDYEERIDSQNLWEKTQNFVQDDFFPGSTQKQNFLNSLGKALVEKMRTEKGKWPALGYAVASALNQRHLLFYFNDPRLEETVLGSDWGGQIKAVPCPNEPTCLGDFWMAIEANLGVNKVNRWVRKEIKDEITLEEDGQAKHRLTLLFKNSSLPTTPHGGTYKNYLRIYTPTGSRLEELKLGGVIANAEVSREDGKTIFGFYLEVEPGSQKEVVVTYRLPLQLSPKLQNYRLLVQKQAGTQSEPLSLSFSNLSDLTKTRELEYNGTLEFDRQFQAEFLK